EAIEHDWGWWGRPNQLAPKGDWRTWLLLAGRGFGKTRSGAECIRDQVIHHRRRIALVAPTAADARDVMVEGEALAGVYRPASGARRRRSKLRHRRRAAATLGLYRRLPSRWLDRSGP